MHYNRLRFLYSFRFHLFLPHYYRSLASIRYLQTERTKIKVLICTYLSWVIWKQNIPLWYQQYKKLSQTWEGCHWRPWQSTWFAMGETSVHPVYKTAFIFSKIMLKMFNLHHIICRNLTWRNEQRSKHITEMD